MKSISSQNRIKFLLLCLMFLAVWIPERDADAAVLKVRYHDTTYSYTGTQAGVTVDGTSVSLGSCPGLILDDTVLLPLEDVFQKALGVETSYDSESGEITLSQFGNTVIMYIDSTTAYINGEKKSVSTTPLFVKYVSASEKKVLVPARFTAEALGYTYVWNASKKRAEITVPLYLYYDEQWVMYSGVQGKVTADGSKVSLGKMPAIKLDGSILVPGKKVFDNEVLGTSFQYDENKNQAAVTRKNTTLTFTLGSKTVLVNGTETTAPVTARLVKNSYNNVEYVMLPVKFIAEQLDLSYSWNTKTKTAELYTSKDQQLEDSNMYFSEETSSSFSGYLETLSSAETGYSFNGGGKNASILGVFCNENAVEYAERYIISSEQPLGEISVSYDSSTGKLEAVCKNTSSENTDYSFENKIISGAVSTYNDNTGESVVTFQAAAGSISYQASLSNDQCNLYIDIYKNCLTSISASKYGSQELLVMTGAMELENSYTAENNVLQFTFPHTMSGIVTKEFAAENSSFVKSAAISEQVDQSLLVTVTYKGKFYLQVSEANIQVIFYQPSTVNADNPDGTDSASFDIYIPLPDGVNYKNITDKDPYADKSFQILIPGDHVDFFKKNPVISNNNTVKKIKVALNSAGSKTVITVKTTKIRGYRFYDANGAVGLFLGSLQKMYKNIVLLDAGHGGKDSGATNGSYMEKTFNLTILYKKAKQYFQKSDSIKAYWTRADDTFVNLYERPKISAKAKADLFISLHMNSASSSSAKGLEVYYSKNNTSKTSSGLTSKLMASYFQDSLISKIGCYDRGFKSAEYVVLKYNTVPSVLIELGFISNSQDLARMKDSGRQTEAAKAIYDTVEEIFEKYPTGR